MTNDLIRYIAAKPKATAVPDMGTQVANDLKDTVVTAAETAGNFFDKVPVLLSRTLFALAVLVAAVVVTKIVKLLINHFALRKGRRNQAALNRSVTSRSIFSSIFSYVMFFAAMVGILALYDVDVTSILAAAGVVGVAIAFGAQTLVKDILSGLFIWSEKSMAVGDLVSINGMDGTVESITIRTTAIRNYNGNIVTVPNGDIRAITNMSRGFKRAIVNVPCPYEINQEYIVAILKEEMEIAADEVEGIEEVPAVMSIVAFDRNAVRIQVAVTCPVGEHWRIERELRTRIKARFDAEGIMMPHYTVPEAEN